jgi:hypothetical protein
MMLVRMKIFNLPPTTCFIPLLLVATLSVLTYISYFSLQYFDLINFSKNTNDDSLTLILNSLLLKIRYLNVTTYSVF